MRGANLGTRISVHGLQTVPCVMTNSTRLNLRRYAMPIVTADQDHPPGLKNRFLIWREEHAEALRMEKR